MGRRKREPMSEGKKNIIAGLLQEYDIKTAKDIEDALKDLLGGTIQEMLESEMDEHLGYHEYERSDNPDYRNGKKTKKIRGNFGETEIEVPQDRDGTFEPKVVKKRQKDISGIEQKIISLYAKGMTTRQISETIEDIYGFEVSDGMVSDITDESLNSGYRRLNKQRSVFPGDTALLKALYLATHEIAKKWTMPLRNWGKVLGELEIMYPDRLG
ncbi:MAG: transposase [Oscillospiraceae bacterium]|nr:transposase [Oscillospiraceae bacterium]